MSTPTSAVLNRAADLIQERGWAQGSASMEGHGGVCIMAALHLAHTGRLPAVRWTGEVTPDPYTVTFQCPAGQAVWDYLALDGGEDAAWEWNDDLNPFVGGGQVVEVLRAAAAIEQAREADLSGTGECELTAQGVAS